MPQNYTSEHDALLAIEMDSLERKYTAEEVKREAGARPLEKAQEKKVAAYAQLFIDLVAQNKTQKFFPEKKQLEAEIYARADKEVVLEKEIDAYLHMLHLYASSKSMALYQAAEILKKALLEVVHKRKQKKPKEDISLHPSYIQLEKLSCLLSKLTDAQVSGADKIKAIDAYIQAVEGDHRFKRNIRLLLAFIIFVTTAATVAGAGGTAGVLVREFVKDSIKYWKSPADFLKAMREAIKHLHPKSIDYVDICTVVAGGVVGAVLAPKAGTLIKNSFFKTDAVIQTAKEFVHEAPEAKGECSLPSPRTPRSPRRRETPRASEENREPDLLHLVI